jgi:Dolichyl-phosphate-mannose-protein mannosyltransferase
MSEVALSQKASDERLTSALGKIDPALAAVTALTVIAFALRVSQLHQSLVGDEVSTYLDISHRSFGTVLSTVHTGAENSPPLYFMLAWFSAKLGDPTELIRLPSLLLGSATVPVVYAIGRMSVGRAAGLVGAAICALAPFTVYYGIEARPYATMTFFVALSTLALLRAVETKSRAWWALYIVAASAAAYTHYTAIFVLGVQGLWSLWVSRKQIRVPLLANLLVALLYLPWLPHLRGKALSVISALYPLSVHRVLTDVLRPIPGHPGAPLSAIPTIPGLVAIALCALIGAVALVREARMSLERLPRRSVLLVASALATPIGLLVYSLSVTDLWLPRGLSASVPATALVLGGLLVAMPRVLRVAGVTVVLAVLVAGTIRSFDAAYARPPFRVLAGRLDKVAGRDDPVLLLSFIAQPAISVELTKPHRLVKTLPELWSSIPPGTAAYVVLDESLDRALKLGTPHHPGFHLTSRQRYLGDGFATDLLVYRR